MDVIYANPCKERKIINVETYENPIGVYTLVFPKDDWGNVNSIKKWIEDHKTFGKGSIVETRNTYRFILNNRPLNKEIIGFRYATKDKIWLHNGKRIIPLWVIYEEEEEKKQNKGGRSMANQKSKFKKAWLVFKRAGGKSPKNQPELWKKALEKVSGVSDEIGEISEIFENTIFKNPYLAEHTLENPGIALFTGGELRPEVVKAFDTIYSEYMPTWSTINSAINLAAKSSGKKFATISPFVVRKALHNYMRKHAKDKDIKNAVAKSLGYSSYESYLNRTGEVGGRDIKKALKKVNTKAWREAFEKGRERYKTARGALISGDTSLLDVGISDKQKEALSVARAKRKKQKTKTKKKKGEGRVSHAIYDFIEDDVEAPIYVSNPFVDSLVRVLVSAGLGIGAIKLYKVVGDKLSNIPMPAIIKGFLSRESVKRGTMGILGFALGIVLENLAEKRLYGKKADVVKDVGKVLSIVSSLYAFSGILVKDKPLISIEQESSAPTSGLITYPRYEYTEAIIANNNETSAIVEEETPTLQEGDIVITE